MSRPFMRNLCLAVTVLALGATPTLPALAQGAAPAAAAPVDAAKVDIGIQIVRELKFIDILILGGQKGMRQNPEFASTPASDWARLDALFAEEMHKRGDTIIRKMAEANVGAYSTDDLNHVLALAKIKYVQDLVLQGADSSLVTPDFDGMTAAEKATFDTYSNDPAVTQFLSGFTFGSISGDISDAVIAALTRYDAEKTPAR